MHQSRPLSRFTRQNRGIRKGATDCRDARARLRYELLEPRYLLAAGFESPAPTSNDSTDAPVAVTWFESFTNVQRIAPESLATVDPMHHLDFIGPHSPATGEWIVQLTDEVAREIRQLAPSTTDPLLDAGTNDFTLIAGLGSEGLLLVHGRGASQFEIESSLAANAAIESFQLNQVIEGQETVPNEGDFNGGQLPGLETIGMPTAWDESIGSSQTVVGVVDSGIDPTHPDLYLNMWLNQGELPPEFLDDDGNQLVDIDGDGLITFYDLNNATRLDEAPYTLTVGGFDTGPNAEFVNDLNENGRIDAQDLLLDTNWADGRDTDGNGFFDDFFGVNFRAGADDPLAPNDPSDTLGHGTHVAGTIGAIGNNGEGVVGVNWRTSLMSLRILDNNNRGDTGAALRAVNYATMMQSELDSFDGRITQGADVRVLNNSWGQPGGYEPSLERAIQDSADEGILFVAAAGNGNILGQGVDNDRTPFFPASYDSPNVIAVTASNASDDIASFANFGSQSVDIAAPGVAIRSTLTGGRYGAANGTSMAAPHVAGAAALIFSANPQATLEEVSEAILTTVSPLRNGSSSVATGGRVDIGQAISSDAFAPSASVLAAPTISVAGGASAEINVEYRHRDGIDPATLGNDDLTVFRTWGSDNALAATLQSGSVVVRGDTVAATYVVAAPGGNWDPLDFGRYRIETNAGGVLSLSGNATETREVGFFRVRIDDPSVLYVERFDDSTEPGSLRHAIKTANAAGAPRTIVLDSGTYTIGIAPVQDPLAGFFFPPPFCASWDHDGLGWSTGDTGDFVVTGDITIAGNSMDDTVVDGSGLDRVFRVSEGGSLTLSRLAVTGGVSAPDQGGGGILSAGELTLLDTLVRDNTAVSGREADPIRGGGIALWNGSVDLQRSWVHGNQADYGGGIFVCNSASAQISQSTLDANVGGGLHSHSDRDIEVVNSTFSANEGRLGAVFNGKQDDVVRDITFGDAIRNADGRYTAFVDIDHSPTRIRVLDDVTKFVEYASVSSSGAFANDSSFSPSISDSGFEVVFESDASNLVTGDANGMRDVFLHDRNSNETILVSQGIDGSPADGPSSNAQVSGDGRYVAFVSSASNLVPEDTNDVADIFVFDRVAGTIERLSVGEMGAEADEESRDPTISDDGRFVAFASTAGSLDPTDTNRREDAFIVDRAQGTIQRIDVGASAANSFEDRLMPMISGDGKTLVFQSLADDLLPIDVQIERAGGAAANLDGVDDRIVIADEASLRAPEFTVELLALIDSMKVENRDVLISKTSDENLSDGYGFFYDSGRIHFFASGQANVVSAEIRLDRVQHLVGTFDGNTIRLFVNGIEEDSLSFGGPLVHSNQPLILGGASEGDHFFGGTLDEVAIYDLAMTSNEIQEHASSLPLEYSGAVTTRFPVGPLNHDDFADRRDLGSTGIVVENRFDLNLASSEQGEPSQSGRVNSVWWSWTAPFDGTLDVYTTSDFEDGPFGTFLTIAEGNTLDELIVLAQSSQGNERGHARVTAEVERGKEYAISVDGYESIQGRGELELTFDAVNMDPANRIDLGSAANITAPGFSRGENWFSSSRPQNAYWSWTAPADGTLVAQVDYEGDDRPSLRVGIGDGKWTESERFVDPLVSTNVVAGQVYLIDVGVARRGTSFDLGLDFFDDSYDQGNDAFSSAVDLGSVYEASVTGSNGGYSGEPGEIGQSGVIDSAWWKWTAPSDGMLIVDTVGSRFQTFLTVAQGSSPDQLAIVAQDDENPPFRAPPRYPDILPNRLVLTVQAGEEYYIAVDGLDDKHGILQLNVQLLLNNDDFDNRIDLGSQSIVEVAGTNLGFTQEPGEPAQDGEVNSAWWSWTAPADGLLSVDLEDSEITPHASVFVGDNVNNLMTVYQDRTSHRPDRGYAVPVEAGVEYQIAVDGFRWSDQTEHYDQGTYRLKLDFEEYVAVANDLFDDRFDLGSVHSASVGGNNEGFVNDFSSGRNSAWWSWTAPEDGAIQLQMETEGYSIAISNGDNPTSLTELDSGPATLVPIVQPVTAGTTYTITVGLPSFGPDEAGDFEYTLEFTRRGTNDDFADRIDLGAVSEVTSIGNNIGFTGEAGEIARSGELASSWYSWTAPSDGLLSLRVSNDFYLRVGSGNGADNFVALAEPSFGDWPPTLVTQVDQGVTYQIVVEGVDDHAGPYEIDLQLLQNNDLFADRIDLGSATEVRTTGYNWEGYTGEQGEPPQSGSPQSAWWQWTAPADGSLKVTASYESFYSDSEGTFFLTLATGTHVSALSVLAQQEADSFGELNGAVSISIAVDEGESYQIAVDLIDRFLNDYRQYPIELDLQFTAQVDNGGDTNDAFEHRIDLGEELSVDITGTNLGFTREPGEPSQSGPVHSAWYSWTAPADGVAWLTNRGDSPTGIGFWTGNAVDQLNFVVGGVLQSSGWLIVRAGQTYQIGIDGPGVRQGAFDIGLELSIAERINNDLFVDSVDLGTIRALELEGSNWGFTAEPEELGRTDVVQSAWYSWTAPDDGLLKLNVPAPTDSTDPVITVFTGGSIATLSEVDWNDDVGRMRVSDFDRATESSLEVSVEAGTTYHISIDTVSSPTTAFRLLLEFEETLGDRITSRQPVGFWRFDTSLTDTALDESGEQMHGVTLGGLSPEIPGLLPASMAAAVNKVYVYDRETADVSYVMTDRPGLSDHADVSSPAISSDGRYLVVSSDASKQNAQIWLVDKLLGTTTELPYVSQRPRQVSDDGRFVIFDSSSGSVNDPISPSALGDNDSGSENDLQINPQTSISTIEITRSTIANTLDADVAVVGNIDLHDVLLSGNTGRSDIDFARVNETNLVFSSTPGSELIGDLVRYGGGAPVHPIQRGNPALDAGTTGLNIPVDQRGEPRDVPDIGAYEATSGAVAGRLFLDFNGNQIFDRTEVGLFGPQVVARRPGSSFTAEPQADNLLTPQNDEAGLFLLDGLSAGDYLVSVEGFPDWRISAPDLTTFPQQALEPNARLTSRISRNGRFVAFQTSATNILPSDTSPDEDIYLFDVANGTTALISSPVDHGSARWTRLVGISDDGRMVLYTETVLAEARQTIYAYDRIADESVEVHERGGFDSDGILLAFDGQYVIYEDSGFRAPTYVENILSGERFSFSDVVPPDIENAELVGYSSLGPEFIYTGTSQDSSQGTIVGIYSYKLLNQTHETLYTEVADSGSAIEFHSVTTDGAVLRFFAPSSSTARVLDRMEGTVSPEPLLGPLGDAAASSSDQRFTAVRPDDFHINPAIEIHDRLTGEVRAFDVPTAVTTQFSDLTVTMTADGRFAAVGRYLIANPFESLIGVSIEDGDLVTGFDIGMVPDPGKISGTVFEDIAPNTVRDEGEPSIVGWRVFLDLNENELLDAGEPYATTNSDGYYEFEKVNSFQEHTIRLEVREGFAQASPDVQSGLAWNIFLPAGGEITDRDFAVQRVVNTPQSTNSSVSGRLFDDVNDNEMFDPGVDRPHENVRIYLDANNDRQHNPGTNEPITRTDAEGRYQFDGLGSRILSVSTILDAGTVHASPLGNSYTLETYPLFSGIQPFGNPQAIDIGDFNGDGHGDVAVLLAERNQIAIRLNNGHGGFDSGGFEINLGSQGSGPVAMVVGQFNGAGTRPDIAVASQFSSNAVILLDVDAVSQTVSSQTALPVDDEPADVTAADLTGDGHLDLVVANQGFPSNSSISVLINQGDGTFVTGSPILTGGRTAVSVVAGEFTGDAHLDVAVVHASPSLPTSPHGDVRVLAGNGLGGFSYDGNRYEVGALPTDLLTNDFNGDGLADLAVANFASNTISLLSGRYENGSSGPVVFQVEEAILGTASGAIDIALGDMDGDSDVDILASNLTDRNISIFRNVSSSDQIRFEPLQNVGLGQFAFAQRMPLIAANVDGDNGGVNGEGTLDVITVPRLTDTLHVLTNELINGAHRVQLDGQNDVIGLDFRTRPAILPPTFDTIANPSPIVEDAGPQTISIDGIVIGRATGPDLQFTVTSDNPALIPSPGPLSFAGGSSTTFIYTPVADAHGTAILTVRGVDAGADEVFGSEDDGIFERSFEVSVLSVNDAPEFNLVLETSALQTAGATTITDFVTAVGNGGGSDEDSQTREPLIVTATDPNFFSVQPAIDNAGTLTFTPSPEKSGAVAVTVTLRDDGGTANNGIDTTIETFIVNVLPVNERPMFAIDGDLAVQADAGAQSFPDFAHSFSPGGGDDETAQVVSDYVVTTDAPGLFEVLPDISNDGTLTFDPAVDRTGVATVTVKVRDSGGVDNGGVDLSLPGTFQITITPVPDTTRPLPVLTTSTEPVTNQPNFLVTVDFGEAVDGFTLEDVVARGARVSDLQSLGNGRYTLLATADNGLVQFELEVGAARDLEGNDSLAATSDLINVDTAPPVVSLSALPGTVAGSFDLTIEFDESVTGLDANDFLLSNARMTDLQGSEDLYTAKLTANTFGDLTIQLPEDRVADALGNRNGDSPILTLAHFPTSIVLTGSDEVLDIAAVDPELLGHVRTIDIRGNGPNQLVLDADLIRSLSPNQQIVVIADADDRIVFDADWQYVQAEVVDDQFRRVFENDSALVRIVGPRAWTNPIDAADIDGDGRVRPADALSIINALNRGTVFDASRRLLDPRTLGQFEDLPFYDADQDDRLAPVDALFVINRLNRQQTLASGEAAPFEWQRLTDADRAMTPWQQEGNSTLPAAIDKVVTFDEEPGDASAKFGEAENRLRQSNSSTESAHDAVLGAEWEWIRVQD